jgi:hypothetical protein
MFFSPYLILGVSNFLAGLNSNQAIHRSMPSNGTRKIASGISAGTGVLSTAVNRCSP